MKKLLRLLAIVTVTAPAIANTTACSNNNVSKPNLNSITQLTGLTLKSHVNDTFSQLNDEIAGANEFQNKNLATSYTMTYYNVSGDNITNDPQNIGTFYVQIKAADSDPNWTGTSSKLLFTLHSVSARNLDTVTSLTGLNLSANSNDTFDDLKTSIAASNEFSGSNPTLDNNYVMNFYQSIAGESTINATQQPANGGTFYVQIIASQDDVNWFGQTTRLSFTLASQSKTNLNGLLGNAIVTGVS